MGRLVIFGRKINLAYDDLYIPAAYGVVLHSIWLSCTGVAYATIVDDCSLHKLLKIYTLSVIIIISIQLPLDIIILILSMMGTVAKPGPRRYLSPFIHISTLVVVAELAIQCFGVYVAYGPFNLKVISPGCNNQLPTQSVVLVHMVIAWSFVALCIWFLILSGFLFSSGRSKGASIEKQVGIWQRRLELFCFRRLPNTHPHNSHHHHHSNHHHLHADSKDVMRDVANELADLFHDVDWAPSDIALGLILLKREQKRIVEVRQARRLIIEQPKGFSLPQLDSNETLHELATIQSASTEVANLAIIGGGPNGTLSMARGYSPTPTVGSSIHSSTHRKYVTSLQPRRWTKQMAANPSTPTSEPPLRRELVLLNDLESGESTPADQVDVELSDRKVELVVEHEEEHRGRKRRMSVGTGPNLQDAYRDVALSSPSVAIPVQPSEDVTSGVSSSVDSDGTTLSNRTQHDRNASSSSNTSATSSSSLSISSIDRKTPSPSAMDPQSDTAPSNVTNVPSTLVSQIQTSLDSGLKPKMERPDDRRPSVSTLSTTRSRTPSMGEILARKRAGSLEQQGDASSYVSQPITEASSTAPLQPIVEDHTSPTSPTNTLKSWANRRPNIGISRSQTAPVDGLFSNLRRSSAGDPMTPGGSPNPNFKPWTFRRRRMNHRVFRRGSNPSKDLVDAASSSIPALPKAVKGTVTREEIDDILHFARFAEIVYNPDDIAALFDSDRMVRHKIDNALFLTPYLIVRDPDTETVVIAVRGTFSTADVLVDLKFDLEEFEIPELEEDGCGEVHYAHSGMLRTARNIVRDIERDNILKPILGESGSPCFGWPLVVTGHSLGASSFHLSRHLIDPSYLQGVAALVTSMLRSEYPTACCYAYEPPGCLLSAAAATHFESFCTSLIMGDDIVPRTSKNSMEMLKMDVRRVIMACDHPKWRVFGSVLGSRLCCQRRGPVRKGTDEYGVGHESLKRGKRGAGRVIKDRPGLLHRRTPSGKLFPEDLALIKRRTQSLRAGNRMELMANLSEKKTASTWFHGLAPDGSQVVLPSMPMFVPGRILHMEKFRRPPLGLNQAIGGALNRAMVATTKAGEFILDGAEGIKDRILDGAEGIKDRILDGADNIKDRIIDGAEGIKDRFKEGTEGIKDRIKEGTGKFAGGHHEGHEGPSTSAPGDGPSPTTSPNAKMTGPFGVQPLTRGDSDTDNEDAPVASTANPFRLWKGLNSNPPPAGPVRAMRKRAGSLDTLTSVTKFRRRSLGDIHLTDDLMNRGEGRVFGRLRRDQPARPQEDTLYLEGGGVHGHLEAVDARDQRRADRERRRMERRARSRSRKRRVDRGNSRWEGGGKLRSGKSIPNLTLDAVVAGAEGLKEEPAVYSSSEDEGEDDADTHTSPRAFPVNVGEMGRRTSGGDRGRALMRFTKEKEPADNVTSPNSPTDRTGRHRSKRRSGGNRHIRRRPSAPASILRMASDWENRADPVIPHLDPEAFLPASTQALKKDDGNAVKVVPLHIAPSNPSTAGNAAAAVRRRRASSVASRHRMDLMMEEVGVNPVPVRPDVDAVVVEVKEEAVEASFGGGRRRPSAPLHVTIAVDGGGGGDEIGSPIELSKPLYPPSSLALKKGKAASGFELGRTGKYHYIPRWARKEEFCEIVVSRTMVLDHFPFELLREFQNAPAGSVLGVVTRD
ncbi:hypothetical protein HDU67_003894 [Dinochytrium kinnereticum]|nr:hypothetical protein HDU67_003894 [Dinochytrium kinnereticum]